MLLLLFGCVENEVGKRAPEETGTPSVRVEPATLDFGALPYEDAATRALTVWSVGDVALTVEGIDLGGLGGAAFTLVDPPVGAVLEPGDSVSIDVVFTALSPSVEDTVRVRTDDPGEPAIYVPLSGVGAFGLLSVSPNPVDFGNTAAGTTLAETATLENVGQAALDVQIALVTGDAFTLVGAPALPLTLVPGETAPVELGFTPPTEGLWDGLLWLTANDVVGTRAVPLEGTSGEGYVEDPEDACEDADYGADQHAGTRIFVEDDAAPVVVTYLGTNAGYTNELWLDEPEERRLAVGYDTPVGEVVALGPYGVGTELVFSVRPRETGDHFQSGPGDRNADGVVHAATRYVGACTWFLGFEDLFGGGDQDFDDIALEVAGVLGQTD